jgi:uncharacterized protein
MLLDYLIEKWNSPLNVSHGQIKYISFYGGEPLLNMAFIKATVDYMKNAKLIHNHYKFSMTTNAVLLDRYLPYLVENDFNLLISLDGGKEGHSYRVDHTGNNSFDRVYANIKLVQESYPAFFETNVNFNSVLHNRNSVAGIYHFIKEEFGKLPAISELNNTGIVPEKRDEFFETYQNATESLYQAEDYSRIKQDMFLKLSETRDIGLFLFNHSGNMYQGYNDLFSYRSHSKRTPTGTCKPFGKKMFVSVNGKILPCERVGHQYSLGNVDVGGVHLDSEKIARKYNDYFKKLRLQCNRCYNVDACIQCIFQLDDLEEKPVCRGYVGASDFRRHVNLSMHYLRGHKGMYKKMIDEVIIQD